MAKGVWSWPLGRIELRERDVLAYTPVFFGHGALQVSYVEISKAVVEPHRWGGKIRLHRSASNSGDVTVTTVGNSYVKIADLLRDSGVHITEEPRRFANRSVKPS